MWVEIDQTEVLLPDQPVFVNLLDDGGDESQSGLGVWKDTDDPGAPANLTV